MVDTITHCVENDTKLCRGCARLPIARMVVSVHVEVIPSTPFSSQHTGVKDAHSGLTCACSTENTNHRDTVVMTHTI